MMDLSYQRSQPYAVYENPQWPEEFKPTFAENDYESIRDDRHSASATPADFSAIPHSRRPSMLKVEDEYAANEAMWHNRQHEPHYPTRHYSLPTAPTHGHDQSYMRIDPNFAASYAQPQPWSMSQSGTNTPTPAYHSVDSFGQPVQYAAQPFNFNQDPTSAVSMSPQSSQGGWASATSNDSAEQRCVITSPFRPVSPQLVLRPDGVRKKNARFEIPKERNLQTIDALILASTDENEKKELKQQKRLLRNRQAALDSRQRKKSHTEKLEHEKKVHEKKMVDLEDNYIVMEQTLMHEREQWRQQRQQYEIQAQQLVTDREEAIKAKNVEAADYRRQINAMKDYIREQQFERPVPRSNGYAPASDMNNIASDFSEFNFDDEWENEFSLVGNDDLRMEELDSIQRQATPKPLPAPTTSATDKNSNTDFSWSTFYMCLLFGAVVVSAGDQISKLTNTSSELSALPRISDEYRADAQNVLKAAMASNPHSVHEMIPTKSVAASTPSNTVSRREMSQMSMPAEQQSKLDRLSSTLTAPTRHQQLQQMFSMTPAQYNHIVNPMDGLEDDDEAHLRDSPPKPSRLEQAYAVFQAKKAESEAGFRTKAEERSALNVPDNLMQDFRDFVQQTKAERNE